MKRMPLTRNRKLDIELGKVQDGLYSLSEEKKQKEIELFSYSKKHRSLNYEIRTWDTDKLDKIYNYFDKRYPVEWQGGLRNDNRGMELTYWLYDDPDYMIFHLTSISKNICFSGSTSWLVKAKTLEDKVKVIKQIKDDILKILGRR